MLNDEQKLWVTKKMYELQEKYEPLMPLSDAEWENIINDFGNILKLSKNNADVRRVVVIMQDWFRDRDKLAKELSI